MNISLIRHAALALMPALAPVALATTFTVTNLNDVGPGSLRDAINLANLDNDPLNPTIIAFAVPPALLTPTGVAVIRPLSPLPVIQNVNGRGIRVDGYTQPLSSFVPGQTSSLVVKVELDGGLIPVPYVAPPPPAPQFAHGLCIMSSNNRVQGLCVHSFPHDGISIQGIQPQPPPPNGNGHPGSNANLIYWNLVGTDVTGTVAMPNGHDQTPVSGGLWGGIYVKVLPGSGAAIANQNHILENVASGNTIEGIGISSCPPGDVQQNHVERCYAGIDLTGVAPLGNGHQGIYIGESAHHNVIDQNWVGANGFDGVGIVGYAPTHLVTHSNTLIRNRIGVDVNLNPMPNQWHGVAIGSYGGTAWGFAPDNLLTSNVIAYNMHAGVAVQEDLTLLGDNDSSRNKITQNSIHDNGMIDPGYLGIDLAFEPGVTPNDPGDGDLGANELVNFPVIGSAIRSLGTTTVSGTLDTPNLPAVIEVFKAAPDPSGYGEGAVYLGSVTMAAGPNWSVALTGGLPGQLLTATATDAAGNTSEFALNVPVWDQNQQTFDFGDAPDPTYPTLNVSGGPAHQIVPGMYLGQSVDGEPDGQPDANATGDDNDGNDDEDGVVFPLPLIPGQVAQVDITASRIGWIDAWVDFDGNGSWGPVAEQIVGSGIHPGGGATISYSFNVPPGAVLGPTFARIRYSSGGGLLPGGPGPGGNPPDGEVEDHKVQIGEGQEQRDWGDAPDNPGPVGYRTLAINGGANHLIVPGVFLGIGIDAEPDGQPQVHALGDDNGILYGGVDDEDGVVFTSPVVLGGTVTLQVQASVAGFLNAWVDFNRNGIWDAFEKVFSGQPLAAGMNALSFAVPAGAVAGTTYARFRFNTQVLSLPFGGPAPDGEVEDYILQVEDGTIEHKMHWAQLPDPNGWDVRAYEPKILADDFRCTESGPITRITFWGSWKDDEVSVVANVHLSIHKDDRSGEYSKPLNPPLWEWDVPAEEVLIEEGGQGMQGWYDPNTGEVLPQNHNLFFKYTIVVPETSAFVQEEGNIYWLDIQVDSPYGHWGWKTSRSAHFEDDAVWDDTPQDPPKWNELVDPETGLSLDLAFLIQGEQPQQRDWGDAPDDPLNPNDYPTLGASNGARHAIVAGPGGPVYQLGPAIDAEADGQPTAGATGDDLNPPLGVDDEDGVVFATSLIPGVAAVIQVQASAAGFLNGWLDLNADGDWADPGEWMFNDLPLAGGPASIGFLLPAGTKPGLTYARFRFTSQPFSALPGLNEGGPAPDGEVEDYRVRIEEEVLVDWGDAPDPAYPTLILSNGARHVIVPGIQLGPSIDGEPNGQPDPQALGDDMNVLFPGAPWPPGDEDGVYFYPLIPGQMGAIDVTVVAPAGGAAFVDAWIDFNNNGSWLDPGEQVAVSAPVTTGLNQLVFNVPAGIGSGLTFTRIRLSSAGGLAPTGPAADGEVEDYQVRILREGELVYDFGDAPDPPYPTRAASNGARHLLGGPLWFGALVDAEPDGQPDPQALGDDLNLLFPGGPDDEDGVSFPYPLIAGRPNVVVVNATAAGLVDAWVDFDGNGVWIVPEQILVSVPVVAGTNILPIFVPPPAGAGVGATVARFRISSAGLLGPTGFARDGEVEDHMVMLFEDGKLDWGDAPDPTYPTRMASLGAAHWITALFLGGGIDPEWDGQPNATATGDDLAGIDDEDGVGFTTAWISGYNADVTVAASQAGTLQAWADFDGDGTWLQTGEAIIAGLPVVAGPNSFTFQVPAGLGPMNACARFRLSQPGVGVGFGGYTQGGEVEDYMVPVGKRISCTISLTTPPPTVALNWTAEPGATQYSVYSSTTLGGPFPRVWTLEAAGIAGTSWSQVISGPRKFFTVVAFP